MKIKPEPVVLSTVCSLCDLTWEHHGDEPSVLDCIRLLKEQYREKSIGMWGGKLYEVKPGVVTASSSYTGSQIGAVYTWATNKPEDPPAAVPA